MDPIRPPSLVKKNTKKNIFFKPLFGALDLKICADHGHPKPLFCIKDNTNIYIYKTFMPTPRILKILKTKHVKKCSKKCQQNIFLKPLLVGGA